MIRGRKRGPFSLSVSSSSSSSFLTTRANHHQMIDATCDSFTAPMSFVQIWLLSLVSHWNLHCIGSLLSLPLPPIDFQSSFSLDDDDDEHDHSWLWCLGLKSILSLKLASYLFKAIIVDFRRRRLFVRSSVRLLETKRDITLINVNLHRLLSLLFLYIFFFWTIRAGATNRSH